LRQNKWITAAFVALVFLTGGCIADAVAQTASSTSTSVSTSPQEMNDVRLFRSWAADAVFTPGIDLEPVFNYAFFDPGNRWFGGARAAAWVADGLEVGGQIGWGGFSPDNGDSESGFADLDLFGRYRLPVDFGGTMAVGTELSLPTGSAEAGQDETFVRIFGALRQEVGGAMTFAANMGFEYAELFNDDATGLALGFGSLVPVSESLTAVFEFNLRTAFDYTILTGGVDYELPPGGHLRAAIGIGLADQAPDVDLQVALTLPVF